MSEKTLDEIIEEALALPDGILLVNDSTLSTVRSKDVKRLASTSFNRFSVQFEIVLRDVMDQTETPEAAEAVKEIAKEWKRLQAEYRPPRMSKEARRISEATWKREGNERRFGRPDV